MITGIAHTTLLVLEYDKAKQFYCEKLGFIVVEDTQLEKKRWVRLKAPGNQGSEILLSRADNEVQRKTVGNQTGGRVLFFLHTDDFAADFDRLRSMNVEFVEGPLRRPYGMIAVFRDLYGNRIDLIEPSP